MSSQDSTLSVLSMLFLGQEVRFTVDDEGVMWWIAQDVAEILEISQIRSSMRRLDDDEKGVHTVHTLGGPQKTHTVNEYGLYNLILQSRKEKARPFKRWITHDVLPTLRRFGSYSINADASNSKNAIVVPDVKPLPMTPGGHLPSPSPIHREHAEVSVHLAKVWTLIRDCGEPVSNREVSIRTDVSEVTTRHHTKYLRDLGLVDLFEIHPRHLNMLSSVADKRNPGAFERLNRISEMILSRIEI